MNDVVVKRGYAKWIDEDGTRHKVPLDEYNAILEMKGEEPLEGISAPPRGPTQEELNEPEVPNEDEDEVPGTDMTVVERDAEVAERAFNASE